MPKYTIVEDVNIDRLIEAVNKLIALGWVPLGGLVVEHAHYIQSMYLTDD